MKSYIYTDAFECPKELVVRDCYIRQDSNNRVQALSKEATNSVYRAEVLDTPENRQAVLQSVGWFVTEAGEYVEN